MFTDNQCDSLFLGAKSEAKEARIPIYRNFILAWHWQSNVEFRTPTWRGACTILHIKRLQCTLPGQK